MIRQFRALPAHWLEWVVHSRRDLIAENAFLRQQVMMLKRHKPL